jgi:hypothetical protein
VAYPIAFLIFVVLCAACWAVSVALCKSTLGDTILTHSPNSTMTAVIAVGAAALTCFAPFPVGYVAGLVVWGVAAFGGLGLSVGRAAVLFMYLAASSFVARLVVLGVLDRIGN